MSLRRVVTIAAVSLGFYLGRYPDRRKAAAAAFRGRPVMYRMTIRDGTVELGPESKGAVISRCLITHTASNVWEPAPVGNVRPIRPTHCPCNLPPRQCGVHGDIVDEMGG